MCFFDGKIDCLYIIWFGDMLAGIVDDLPVKHFAITRNCYYNTRGAWFIYCKTDFISNYLTDSFLSVVVHNQFFFARLFGCPFSTGLEY